MSSDNEDTPTRKLPRSSRLRRKDLLILKLAETNKRLKARVLFLEEKIERIKRPPLYKRLWAFIKKLFRVK